jgi:hypothetical protein
MFTLALYCSPVASRGHGTTWGMAWHQPPYLMTLIMSNPSNVLAVGLSSQISAAGPSGPVASSSAPQSPTNVITYSHASRLVYVAPAETYDVRPLLIYRFAKFAPESNILLIDLLYAYRVPSILPSSPSGSTRMLNASKSASRSKSTSRK